MTVSRPSIAAAVITYNRHDVLRQCLSALLNQTRQPDEILVIDNASADGTAEMIANEFPTVRVVRMKDNTGPAGGFAVGMREAVLRGHDWVWVFNDDDMADHGALSEILNTTSRLAGRPGIVACARRSGTGSLYPLGAHWRHRYLPLPQVGPEHLPLPADVVAFSGTLVSVEMIREIGVPKGDYFMMLEELEYCLRAKAAGWAIHVLPKPLATALAMGSEGASPPWRGYYQTRNQLALALERRSFLELFWWFVRTSKFCIGAIRAGDLPLERLRLRLLGTWHALRHVTGRTIQPSAPSAGEPA